MDLIAGKLGFRQLAGNQDCASGGIHLFRMMKGLFEGENKDLLQHLDHIVVAVIVVIEQHDAIERTLDVPLRELQAWSGGGYKSSIPLPSRGAGHKSR
jgi:hypothetical protein